MSYDVSQQFISKNRSYIGFKPIGMVLHSTATLNATAQNEHDYFNNNNVGDNAHVFVDDTKIIQTVPWTEKGWHACEPANSMFIGIELCEFNDISRFNQVWNRATWLFAYVFVNILKIDTVTKDNLMSHAEVSNKWKNSNHQDPSSYIGKFGKTVDMFRADVQNQINFMKRGNDMDKVILYLGDADVFAAIPLSQHLGCLVMRKSDFEAKGYTAKEIIYVGGKPNSTRESTFKDVANLL